LKNLINRCLFLNNSAKGSGGAVFSIDSDFLIINSNFLSNSAEIGGAIRYIDYVPYFARNI
jgi:predicted outer membrane repeat protein